MGTQDQSISCYGVKLRRMGLGCKGPSFLGALGLGVLLNAAGASTAHAARKEWPSKYWDMYCYVWSVHARSIPAKHRIPSELAKFATLLEQGGFSHFQSFELLDYRHRVVNYLRPESFVLPGAYELELALLRRPGHSVDVGLRLRRGPERELINHRAWMKKHKPQLLIGGPYTHGSFLLILECIPMLPR